MQILRIPHALCLLAMASTCASTLANPDCAKASAYPLPDTYETLLVPASESALNKRFRFENELATLLCASPKSRKAGEPLLALMTVAEGMGSISEAIRMMHGRIASDTNLNFEATVQNITSYKYNAKAVPTKELKEAFPGEILVRGYVTRTGWGDPAAYPTRPILTVYYGKKGDAHALVMASSEKVDDDAAFEAWRSAALATARELAASVSAANNKQ